MITRPLLLLLTGFTILPLRAENRSAGADAEYSDDLSTFAGEEGPALVVTAAGSSVPIASGSTTTVQARPIDSSTVLSLNLTNLGSVAATPVAVTITGPHAGDFVILAPPAGTIGAGSSSSVRILCWPTDSGTRTATLEITSNDPQHQPYRVTLSMIGIAPNRPEIDILHPDGSRFGPIAQGVELGVLPFPTPSPFTFTLRNQGTMALSGIVASMGGTNPGDFILSAAPPSEIAAGAATTFTLDFTPSDIGYRSAVLSIASNDADENPYVIYLSATATAPRLTLLDPEENPVPAGGSLPDFGNVVVGSEGILVLTLWNSGNQPLENLSAAFSDPAFTFLSSPPETLAAGDSLRLTVVFSPSTAGHNPAKLSFTSGGGVHEFLLRGTGVFPNLPEIVVLDPEGLPLSPADPSVDFGIPPVGGATSRLITVRNDGGVALKPLRTILKKGKGSVFSLLGKYPTVLPPGESMYVMVYFNPTTAGPDESTLTFTSNDPDERVITIRLTGNSLAPRIAIDGPAGPGLVSGRSALDFGTITTGAHRDVGLTARNTGTVDLILTSATFKGGKAAEFSVVTGLPLTVPPGGSATLTVRGTPSAAGKRSTRLLLAANDPELPVFSLALNAIGTRPPVGATARGISPDIASIAPLGVPEGGVTRRVANAFTLLDLDVSRSLTPDELSGYYPADSSYPALLEEFKRLDRNEDWVIAPDEWPPRRTLASP